MAKALREALDQVATLPDADQEKIGQELLAHVEKLRRLRADLNKGIESLRAGKGNELKVEDVLACARERHAK
jgi:hypothetical protein